MIRKSALALALALSLGPSLAAAQCGHDVERQAMTCADGTTYDQESNSCVKITG